MILNLAILNRLPEVDKTESNDTELSYTESKNTEINDMNDLYDIESENEISNHSSQFTYYLVDKDYKDILLPEFPELFLKQKNHLIQDMKICITC
ncbi:hypothetical protein [Staphylococcus aureus]|uniref:hypothetical protein n=1 Tax=Staphylococcus aureus TaxID=1280 RepID=UPI00085182CB|nr:hypothetical protein [Staphylococcus aureus]